MLESAVKHSTAAIIYRGARTPPGQWAWNGDAKDRANGGVTIVPVEWRQIADDNMRWQHYRAQLRRLAVKNAATTLVDRHFCLDRIDP